MADASPVPCPWVGLRPYTEHDRQFFFGRDAEQRLIIANLSTSSLTVLYGASGVGKSSVLLAGVVPKLHERGSPVVVFREWQSEAFLDLLKAECIAAARNLGTDVDVDPHAPLDRVLGAAAKACGTTFLLVFDQFEDYFLYHQASAVTKEFEATIASTVNRRDVDANLVFSLREDGLAALDRFSGRIPDLMANLLRVEHMDAAAARNAILEPLRVYNELAMSNGGRVASIDPLLVDALIEQVGRGRVALSGLAGAGLAKHDVTEQRIETPFLQLVLEKLWITERRDGPFTLRLDTFTTTLGGAQAIVRGHLSDVMSTLPEREQAVCAKVFDRLVTPSGKKITQSLTDLEAYAGADKDLLDDVVEHLSANDARVLRKVDIPGSTSKSFEIFHDVLASAMLDWRARYVAEQDRREAAAEAATEAQRLAREEAGRVELDQAKRLAAVESRKRKAYRIAALATAALLVLAIHQGWQAYRNEQAERAKALGEVALQNIESNPELAMILGCYAACRVVDLDDTTRRAVVDDIYRVNEATRVRYALPLGRKVWDARFTPDGTQFVATTSRKRPIKPTIRMFRTERGKPEEPLPGQPPETVKRIAIDPSGTRLFGAGIDGWVYAWDLTNRTALPPLEGYRGDRGKNNDDLLLDVEVSPGGRWLAVGAMDGMIRVWDANTLEPVTELQMTSHPGNAFQWVFDVAFSADDSRLLAGDLPGHATMWQWNEDAHAWTQSLSLVGHTDAVNSVALSKSLAATGSRDQTARIWNVETGELLHTLRGHRDQVRRVAFSADASTLATAGADETIKLWDVASGAELVELSGHTAGVESIAFTPNGRFLVSGSRDGSVKLWRVQDFRAESRAPVVGLAVSPSEPAVAASTSEGRVRIWNTKARRWTKLNSIHAKAVYRMAFSPDGTRLATAGYDKQIEVFDTATGDRLAELFHDDVVRDVVFGQQGKTVISASADSSVRVWNPENGDLVVQRTFDDSRKKPLQVVALAVSRRDGTLAFGLESSVAIGLADPTTLEYRAEPIPVGSSVQRLAFSWDGRRLAAALTNRTFAVVDMDTRQVTKSDALHGEPLSAIAFSRDGTMIATGSDDHTVRVWDATTLRTKVVISRDGRIWDVAFTPDNMRLVVADAERTFHFFPISFETLASDLRARKRRKMKKFECEKYFRPQECTTLALK
jgi:WD40 repeat protein